MFLAKAVEKWKCICPEILMQLEPADGILGSAGSFPVYHPHTSFPTVARKRYVIHTYISVCDMI